MGLSEGNRNAPVSVERLDNRLLDFSIIPVPSSGEPESDDNGLDVDVDALHLDAGEALRMDVDGHGNANDIDAGFIPSRPVSKRRRYEGLFDDSASDDSRPSGLFVPEGKCICHCVCL